MKNNDTWETLATYFLIFVVALGLGYCYRWGQEVYNDEVSPDKVVVIRHCKGGI